MKESIPLSHELWGKFRIHNLHFSKARPTLIYDMQFQPESRERRSLIPVWIRDRQSWKSLFHYSQTFNNNVDLKIDNGRNSSTQWSIIFIKLPTPNKQQMDEYLDNNIRLTIIIPSYIYEHKFRRKGYIRHFVYMYVTKNLHFKPNCI